MRFVFILLLGILAQITAKTNVKSLTESMGQEVIEIGAPVKDLPPDLEEEPSAEADEADKATSTTLQAATPREFRKESTIETRRKIKDSNKIDNVKQEDDEARIEKELAEMYKDTDYKTDAGEATPEEQLSSTSGNVGKKLGARKRKNFQFQPDNLNDLEMFRTSIDDISCGKNKLTGVPPAHKGSNSGYVPTVCRLIFWGFLVII